MDIYASDEEKAEEIKRWWRENGRSVVAGVVLGAAAIFGIRYWQSHQEVQAENASMLYQQTIGLLQQSEADKAEDTVRRLMQDYSGTAYAVFAALKLAETAHNENDNSRAQEYLDWVVDNAKLESHRDLARLRLARLALDADDYDKAMSTLNEEETDAYGSLFAELEGDINVAQGNSEAAHAAYQQAMLSMQAGDSRQALMQMKLDDVAAAHEG
jgi:predicted negative regulator of RcsB-dependent stress response